MTSVQRIFLLLSLALARLASAYDQNVVHPEMTRAAFAQADAKTSFLKRLGLSSDSRLNSARPADIAAAGATAEDNGERPLNHFYDPLHESALVFKTPAFACVSYEGGSSTARQWALIASSNDYGLAAAQEHYLRTLTEPTPFLREQRAVGLLSALGHMMHLVQDMAQPQHTRNDAHPTSDGVSCTTNPKICWLDRLNLWSRYEAWCRDHAGQLTLSGYPVVSLPSYGAYFSSPDHRGMGDYANRNFVTEHTNYSDAWCEPYFFHDPAETDATSRGETHVVTITHFWPGGLRSSTAVTYSDIVLSYPTVDNYSGTMTVNPNHSFYSYFDYELKRDSGERLWSLPESALASQASLLVPRAVGYSAGLLSHFFRGKVALSWKKNRDGTYDARLTNESSETLSNAVLTVKYVVPPGTHGAAPGQDVVTILNQHPVPGSLPPGGTATIAHLTIPGLATSENFSQFTQRVAVEGTLGSEPHAVIGLVDQIRVTASSTQVQLRIEVWPHAPEDYSFVVDSNPYGNRTSATVRSGTAFVNVQQIPGSRIALPTVATDPLVITIDFFRGTQQFYLQVHQHCDEYPSTFTMKLTLDGEHFGTYTQDLKFEWTGWNNCHIFFPSFF